MYGGCLLCPLYPLLCRRNAILARLDSRFCAYIPGKKGSVIAIKGAPGGGEQFIIVDFPHMAYKENISIRLLKK